MSEQPRFIVLEGLDGAGTTTQTARVIEALRGRGLEVESTSEPSDGPLGRVLRQHVRGEIELSPRAAALGFAADRADHLARVIRPALAARRWVVCDRYLLSTLAYQGAEGVDPAWILHLSRHVDVPDLTILLDVSDDHLAERLAARDTGDGPERYERPGLVGRLREGYLASADLLRRRGHHIVSIDGDRPVAEVTDRILAELATLGAGDTTQRGG